MADDIRTLHDRDFMSLSGRRSMLALSLATLALLGLPMRAQAQTERKPFSPEELDQMLAPIALYDDALLSQVLMAASYPLEIVEAARWSQANPNLKGDAAVSAVADKTWDVSVKSLVAVPSGGGDQRLPSRQVMGQGGHDAIVHSELVDGARVITAGD